ncbi:MAG: Trk family potassium uptake protein [Firmicutes bacterium]|nr:Trk family potassium uptake protein [Bacillota bacterium]
MIPARIILLAYVTAILIGTLLLHLPFATQGGQQVSFIDTFFTATSAVCITGLGTVDIGTTFSTFGQIVILILIQFGGLGIMTMTTMLALLMGRKINLRERLVMQEALNVVSLAGVVRLTKYILIVTFSLELLGAGLLSIRFIPQLGIAKGIYYSIFHSISSFCSAGFDLFGAITGPYSSLTAYAADPLVSLVVAGMIILGGLGFVVLADVYNHRGFKGISLHSKLVFVMTGILILAGALLILGFEYHGALAHLGPGGKVLASLFQSITPRSGGYVTINIVQMQTATGILLIILMFIGASPGGTGGGIKTTTFATLMLALYSIISGRKEITVFKRIIPVDQVLKAMAVTMLSAFLVIIVVIILSFTERADLLTLSFETVSAFATVGLSHGITPHLSNIGKFLIAFTMFAGRLGPLTLAIALWSNQVNVGYRYPEERIIIG